MSHNAPGRSPADRARRAYEHEEAIALYTRALEKGDLSPEIEYELRDGRSWCNERLALYESADADLQVMLQLADKMEDVWRRIESHARRSGLANDAQVPSRAEAEGRAGLPLGIMRETPYVERELQMEPGDLLVFYTDGVTEAMDEAREAFGEGRLRQTVLRHVDLPAEKLATNIEEAARDFTGPGPLFDDFTLMIARRLPA